MEIIIKKGGIIRKRWQWTPIQVKKTSTWTIITIKRIPPNKREECEDLKLENIKRLLKHNTIKPYQEDITTIDSQIIKNNRIIKDYSKQQY